MKFPALPRKGVPVEDTVRDIINYIRATRVVNVVGGLLKESPSGTTISITPDFKQEKPTKLHPWQCTPEAEAVRVNAGVIYGFVKGTTGDATYIGQIAEWTANTVTVTGEGYIYAAVSYDYETGLGTIAVTFSEDAPDELDPDDDEFHIPIAQVSIPDSAAIIDKQILTHNPIIQLIPPTGHPWKVSPNGDGTVAVAAGEVLGWVHYSNSPSSSTHVAALATYGGGNITVTAAGYVYLECTYASNVGPGTVTVEFSEDAPDVFTPADGKFHIPIASVGFAESIASVTKQILTHNPIIQVGSKPHPWQCIANGDDTITIARGGIITWQTDVDNTDVNTPFYGAFVEYAGGTFTVTASGTIYAKMDATEVAVLEGDSVDTFVYSPTTITLELDPTFSGEYLYLPICEVSLVSSIASVTAQYLDHHPVMSLEYAFLPPP